VAASATPATLADHLPTRRPRHYPSDTSDAEWAILAPQIPAGSGRGRPVCYPRRDVVDAIRYLDRTGCQWAALPADFPHPKLVYHYFKTWTADGTLTCIHDNLCEQVRVKVEHRTSQPSAALIDSQSVRAAQTVGRASRGYTGQLVDWAATTLALTVQIVAKLAGQTTFIVLPRRWWVERTFSWINRRRRTVRDYERLPQHHAAMIQWAMIALMTRRLTHHHT
jgi:transposase